MTQRAVLEWFMILLKDESVKLTATPVDVLIIQERI